MEAGRKPGIIAANGQHPRAARFTLFHPLPSWGAPLFGRLAEWLIAPVLKTGVRKRTVGSNPTPSSIFFVSVAQLVEQQSPKLLVAGSNPATYACGCSSVVEHLPSKQSVASPNLVTRSNRCTVVAKKPPQLSEARQSDNKIGRAHV